MSGVDDLATWLRARLDEDYEVARLVLGVNAMADVLGGKTPPRWVQPPGTSEIRTTKGIVIVRHTWAREADHITRWDPARVLAEVDAKRRIIDMYEKQRGVVALQDDCPDAEDVAALEVLSDVIRVQALPYAARPGYREEWRP